MRHVVIKEGEYRPSAFSDLVETVNRFDTEQVGFYTRIDYALRLVRNRSLTNPEMPLAIAHYHVDTASPIQQSGFFRPVDIELMISALETYEYVLFGIISKQHIISDYKLVNQATYIARTSAGKLIDLSTNQVVNETDDTVTFITAFFGMVRMKGLPVYQIIMDSKLLHATDGFDYHHTLSDTMYTLINDHDGSVRDNVFNLQIEGGELYGNTILVTGNELRFSFFKGNDSILRNENSGELIRNNYPNVATIHTVSYLWDGTIAFTPTAGFTTVEITFNSGVFYDISAPSERHVFKYLIVKQ